MQLISNLVSIQPRYNKEHSQNNGSIQATLKSAKHKYNVTT